MILLAASVASVRLVSDSIILLPVLFVCAFVFYLLTGIKDYLFVKRARLYFLAALLLMYEIFVLFFSADKPEYFLAKYNLVILAAFLLMREWLRIIPSFHFPRRELLAAAASAFLIAQLLWAVALLPIGFISSANFMLLFVFVLSDVLFRHFMGTLSKNTVRAHVLLFLLITLLIFSTSRWTIVN
jgi:hypothetical protein